MILQSVLFITSFVIAAYVIGSPTLEGIRQQHNEAVHVDFAHPPGEDIQKDNFILDKLHSRESRRAFYRAPPVIPHRIGKTDKECLTCHTKTIEFQGHTSTPTPHPELVNCQQCHVRGAGPSIFSTTIHLKTNWTPMHEPRLGSKAHPYAPPTMPHRLHMRTNCATCHNKSHPDEVMRVVHSDRKNCMQCHVPDYKQASSPLSPEWSE